MSDVNIIMITIDNNIMKVSKKVLLAYIYS